MIFSGFGEKERIRKADTILVNEKNEVNSVPIHFVSVPENVVIKDDEKKLHQKKKNVCTGMVSFMKKFL